VWDRIIKKKEDALLSLKAEPTEYQIQDNGHNLRYVLHLKFDFNSMLHSFIIIVIEVVAFILTLRGAKMNLTITYVEMPFAGINWQTTLNGDSFQLPSKYTHS
jgi:hypothetical protein